MAYTSTFLTEQCNKTTNPREAEFRLWKKARYLVAQKPASPDYGDTKIGYYHGCMVIPGPMADKSLTPVLTDANDFQLIKEQYFIRFTDNVTTADAGQEVSQALFTIMTDSQADEYEKVLRNEIDGVHSQTT